MPRKSDPSMRVVEAAMKLVAKKGWSRTRMADVAGAADVSLAELKSLFPVKVSLVVGLMKKIDADVLEGVEPPHDDETVRDRLFGILMDRFDALTPYKKAVVSIAEGLRWEGPAALCLVPHGLISMNWILEAAGVDPTGIRGVIRAKGLAVVYGIALKAWLEDDSPDMAKTMAALDGALAKAESLASCRFLPCGRDVSVSSA